MGGRLRDSCCRRGGGDLVHITMERRETVPRSSASKQSRYVFKVRRLDNGRPWILFEPRTRSPQTLASGLLAFNLRLGVSFKQARKLVRSLNRGVVGVARLKFLDEITWGPLELMMFLLGQNRPPEHHRPIKASPESDFLRVPGRAKKVCAPDSQQ